MAYSRCIFFVVHLLSPHVLQNSNPNIGLLYPWACVFDKLHKEGIVEQNAYGAFKATPRDVLEAHVGKGYVILCLHLSLGMFILSQLAHDLQCLHNHMPKLLLPLKLHYFLLLDEVGKDMLSVLG